MVVKIVGVQNLNFTNNSGEVIKGMNIFVAFKDENVEGLRTEKFFLKDGLNIPKDIKANETIDISFNHRGKIEMINKA
ncbi:hypothetical protein JCM1393_10260 [Clostridium carnis]